MTGTEGAWIPYALAAVSAGTQYYGAQQEADDKRSQLNRALQRSSQTADKTATEVVKEGAKYTPDQRALDIQAQQEATAAQSQKDLASGGIVGSAATSGAASPEFQAAKSASDASEGNRISAIAQEMAKVRAPGQQMTEEGLRRSALVGDLSNQWSTTRNLANADQMNAQGVGPSGLSTLGTLAGAIGQAYAAGGSTPTTGDASVNYLNGPQAQDGSLYTVPGKSTPSSAGRVFARGR